MSDRTLRCRPLELVVIWLPARMAKSFSKTGNASLTILMLVLAVPSRTMPGSSFGTAFADEGELGRFNLHGSFVLAATEHPLPKPPTRRRGAEARDAMLFLWLSLPFKARHLTTFGEEAPGRSLRPISAD
jgi:hypothetical protein